MTPNEPTLSAQSAPAALIDLSPSAKLVAKTLDYEGESTQSGLAESTLLPSRTVRYALDQLEDAGVVSSRLSLVDARQRIYSLDLEA